MPHLPRNSFYGVAAFCFFIALIQWLLNSQPRPAAVFATFGVAALLVGWALPNHKPAEDEDDAKQ